MVDCVHRVEACLFVVVCVDVARTLRGFSVRHELEDPFFLIELWVLLLLFVKLRDLDLFCFIIYDDIIPGLFDASLLDCCLSLDTLLTHLANPGKPIAWPTGCISAVDCVHDILKPRRCLLIWDRLVLAERGRLVYFGEYVLQLCALCSNLCHTLLVLLVYLVKAQALRLNHLPLLVPVR